MKWSDRDRGMAVRRVSPGAKVGIFVVALLSLGLLAFFGWNFVQDKLPGSGSTLPEQVVAGETFQPDKTVDLYGTETKTVLDGVSQKVKAENPTKEWKEGLEDVKCNADKVCTAPAPQSGSAAGDGEGNGFMGSGYTISGLIGFAVLGLFMYYLIVPDNNG